MGVHKKTITFKIKKGAVYYPIAYVPMMTVAKCKVISGFIKDLKPWMKVYKYSSPKKEKGNGK